MNAVLPPDSAALGSLVSLLPADLLLTAPSDTARFGNDWSGDHHGRPLAVARPRNVGDVSLIMQHCNRLGIPVVPQGGLTGLVGAAVPTDEVELVMSLDRMDRVRSVNAIDFAMVVEAGCVLEKAKDAAEAAGCILPITFGAQGSCRIGGNVSTNAGGFNVLRYGMTRDLVLGLEVVLPDGRIWNGLKVLRKDNRGYDLKQLFIGSEGTLGIVTAAALKLFPKPAQVETALIGLRTVADAMTLYAHARAACSDLATAFELLMRDTIQVSLREDPSLTDPMSDVYPVYVLLELSSGTGIDLRNVLENALTSAPDIVADAVIASSHEQAFRLWRLRETMVERQGRGESYLRTDISLAISQIPDFIGEVIPLLEKQFPAAAIMAYGHVGDGNLHLNVIPPSGLSPEEKTLLFHAAEDLIFGMLDRFGGSLSAEHGIGRVKREAFLKRIDDVSLDIATRMKQALDPNGILSIGRILPTDLVKGRQTQ